MASATDPRLDAGLRSIETALDGIIRGEPTPPMEDRADRLQGLRHRVNELAAGLTSSRLVEADFELLIDQLMAVAQFDFSRRAPTDRGPEGFRALALGLNILTEEIEAVLQARSEAERRYRQAFETAPIGMVMADTDGSIIQVNPAFAAMLQTSVAALEGRRWQDLTHPDDIEQGELSAERLQAGDNVVRFEKRYVTAQGEVIWGSISVAAVLDEQGAFDHYLAQVVDITEQKRTAEMLRITRDRALQSDRLKTEFLRNMSHEIRTPMTSILGMTELVLATDLTDEQREYLGLAEASGRALLRHVDDLLSLSRIEAGYVLLDVRPTNVATTINEALSPLGARARTQGLGFELVIEPDVPAWVRSDPDALSQILINLVGNALKFTPAGEVSVRVASNRGVGTDHALDIAVRDSGIGVDPDKVQMIFEPFVQADGSTTRGYGGTGLGLAISQRTALLLGGRITVDSKVGSGSTFRLILPAPPVEAPRHDSAPDDDSPRRHPSRLRVLVADDNDDNRFLFVRSLEQAGLTVEAVSNGRDAVEAVRAHAFDIVLMDIQMPGMDGLEAISEIRRSDDPTLRTLPIVAVTAYAMDSDRDLALSAGADGFVAKPFTTATLLEAIDAAAVAR